MSRRKELQDRKAEIVMDMQVLQARAGMRALSRDDQQKFDALRQEAERVNKSLAREIEILEAERTAASTAPIAPGFRRGGSQQPSGQLSTTCKTFVGMFGPSAGNDGFETFDDWAWPIHQGIFHPDLRASNEQRSGVPSEGGFFVPEQHVAEMLDKSLEKEIVRPRCVVAPMFSDTRKVAGLDNLDHSDGTVFGGLSGGWIEESTTIAESAAKVRLIQLTAKKCAILIKVSNELIDDGASFEEQLQQALIAGLGWFLDHAALRGSGVGRPLGALNDPALISINPESGQSPGTIRYQNLVEMFARLHPGCIANSAWVASSTTLPQLLTLTLPIGTGGAHIPVMSETGGEYRILTRPVIFTEKLPTVGTQGDILLADFSQYVIGLRKEISLAKSQHAGFADDTSYYRAIIRADGQGRWNRPFTPLEGPTQSWCVALGTR